MLIHVKCNKCDEGSSIEIIGKLNVKWEAEGKVFGIKFRSLFETIKFKTNFYTEQSNVALKVLGFT